MAEQRLQLLAEASRVLAASLEYEATLQNVGAQRPRLADWCGVYLVGTTEARPGGDQHRDPEQRAVVADLWRRWGRHAGVEHGLARVVRTRESLLVREIGDATLAESPSTTSIWP